MKKQLSFLLLFCALALVSVLAAVQGHCAHQLRHQLTETYRGAILTAMRQMEDMQLSLEKAMLSGEGAVRSAYLNEISDAAGQALRSLSLLPLSHPDTMQAMKLTNQMGDYAAALLKEGRFSPADAAQFSALIAHCRDYTDTLYQQEQLLLAKAEAGPSFYPEQGTETVDHALSYPTLIYDGPFSDAREETPLPLENEKEITWEEAAEKARQLVGADRVQDMYPGADVLGPTPCHGITLVLSDITLEAAVTKKGGKVLWLTPDQGAFESRCSLEQCLGAARAFLQRNGFPDMERTFFQVYEGVAVIAFAAKEGDVLLYPDLVKVQLRMDMAEVVGLETKAYHQHHRSRSLPAPALSAREVRENLSPLLQVDGQRLCLIPKNNEEILCWEFSCTYQDHDYFVYLNALTGRQEEILQIVESAAGLEAV